MNNSVIIKRRNAILSLIATHDISDQDALVNLLANYTGIDSSQAVISRDIRALGIIKRVRNNKLVYALPFCTVDQEILEKSILDIHHNQALIVIHTIGGIASFVADYLDVKPNTGILGTIAGENTIFATPLDCNQIDSVQKNIEQLLWFKRKDSHE